MRRWGITPERTGDDRARRDDHRRAHHGEPHFRRVRRADTAPQRAFLKAGGWSIATLVEGGGRGHGLTTHRGVLHSDEYVDQATLEARLTERLGFSPAEVRSVYRQGPLAPEGRALRARIDARLLEVAEQGGLMAELGRALGFAVKADGHCRTVENALSRARAAREEQS